MVFFTLKSVIVVTLWVYIHGNNSQYLERPIHIISFCGNEVDIIEDWLKYHGFIFGFENMTVVDNYSIDGTYEILTHYSRKYNLNLLRIKDYWQKGNKTAMIIKSLLPGSVALPLDVDELITLFVKDKSSQGTLIANKEQIKAYIFATVDDPTVIYKMPAVWSQYNKKYVRRPILSITNFSKEVDPVTGIVPKSMMIADNVIGMDHGNHGYDGPGTLRDFSGFIETKLRIMHFYSRGYCQFVKKVTLEMAAFGRKSWTADYIDSLQEGTIGLRKARVYAQILRNSSQQIWLEYNSWGEPYYKTSILRDFFREHKIDKTFGRITKKKTLKGLNSC